VVAGPLLGSGYLILLDHPSGPEFPAFSWFPLPSSGDIGNTTPLLALERSLRAIHTYLPDKVLLLAPILLGGVGVARFVTRRLGIGSLPAVYAGTLFVINPFVIDRYLAGHLHFLLGYALLPWALSPLEEATRAPSFRVAMKAGLWLAALAAIDVHVGGIYGILAGVAMLAAPSTRRAAYAGGTVLTGLLVSSYWVVPSLFAPPATAIGPADVAVYASRPEGFGILPRLAGMYGFWRAEYDGPAARVPLLYLLILPILGLVVVGLVRLCARGPHRRFALVLACSGLGFLLLAAGSSFPPTAGVFRWLYDNVFVFRVYREPQKLLAAVVLVYAVFGGVGLAALGLERARARVAAALAALAMVLLYGYTMLWGFWGQVELSRYPESWARADRVMQQRGEGRLLAFPWNLYAFWSFTGARLVANPTPSYFSRDVLIAREAGFLSVPEQSPDPFTAYVTRFLQNRDELRLAGHLLAPLGVRYVVQIHGFNDANYVFLHAQSDLTEIYSSPELTLYENTAWRGDSFGLQDGDTVASLERVFGTELEEEATASLIETPPLRPGASTSFPALARPLPLWSEARPTGDAPHLLTTHRCSDGWVLDDDDALCHLGVSAAFPESGGSGLLWRPLAGARLLGFLVTALTLAFAATYLWRGSARTLRQKGPT
jgi:hypothetical protein